MAQPRKFRDLIMACSVLVCLTLSTLAYSKSTDGIDWWFDVEILIFKYDNASTQITERFPDDVSLPDISNAHDLFTPYWLSDGRHLHTVLPACKQPFTVDFGCTFAAFDTPYTWPFEQLTQTNFQTISKLPINVHGYVPFRSEYAHFLPLDDAFFEALKKDVQWDRSTTAILHAKWRQPVVVGENNASSMRIIAGENLTYQPEQADPLHHTLASVFQSTELAESWLAPVFAAVSHLKSPTTDDIVTEDIDEREYQALNPDIVQVEQTQAPPSNPISQLKTTIKSSQTIADYPDQIIVDTIEREQANAQFELDGLIKIFIKYINGVPYLHIDGDMVFFTQENGELKPHQFQQRRRIISKQVHYFDHPYFGFMIRLVRHKRSNLAFESINLDTHEDLYQNR